MSCELVPYRQPGWQGIAAPGDLWNGKVRLGAGCWLLVQDTPALPTNSHRVAEAVHGNELLSPAEGEGNPGYFTAANVLLTSCGIAFEYPPLCALWTLQLLLVDP